ncbi:MAG TPA: tetratricopeptide repeat protein [Rhizomicrobium sp.]|nr:tetratricopeptide repeat protein [Rhizomicrobium sp.]
MTGRPTNRLAASILEAANLVRQGRWQEADALLARVLASHPGEPDALQLLGLVRENQGRLAEAETLLRQSLALRPRQPHVQVHLGRVLAQTGRYPDAIDQLQAAAGTQPDLFDAFLLLAQVQLTTGDLAASERNYRAALQLSPKSQVALLGLGVLLNKMMRPAEAEACLRTAAQDVARPASWRAKVASNLGQSLEALGRREEAIDVWRGALALDPANAEAHRELNALLYRMGRVDEFLASHEDAIRKLPLSHMAERGTLLLQKAGFLMDAERFEEARDCFAQLAALAPGSAGPQNGLAAAHARLGRLDAAIAAYETSLRLKPDDPATGIHLACVLLQAGERARALRLTDEAVPRMARDQAALAVHELALRANGDPRAERLADYERHIQIFDLEPPPGFSTMAEFNAALDAHLDTLHTDQREPVDQTLRHGTQTAPSLLRGKSALLVALRQRIEEAVGAYIARMSDDADHPLTARRAAGFAFAGSWSSRLHDCGFHANHVHPEGWISSCYYVAVPDAVLDPTARQGWIKFGEPSFNIGIQDVIRRTIQPVPGRLVLFPSYMWHGTLSFRSRAARTTIAFDAVPV